MAERRKPKYLYEVHERLVGEALYHVIATSKAEALSMLHDGRHGGMIESGVDHMGRGTATRLERADDDAELGAAYE